MDLSVTCDCGKNIKVSAAQSGSGLNCSCGRTIDVPALGELRRLAGHSRYDVGIVDRLRQLSSEGSLPLGNNCLNCGLATDCISTCRIECERPWSKENGYWKT